MKSTLFCQCLYERENKLKITQFCFAPCAAKREILAQREKKKQVWVCNQCDAPNFTQSVSKEEIEQELLSCINCGGFEFHLK